MNIFKETAMAVWLEHPTHNPNNSDSLQGPFVYHRDLIPREAMPFYTLKMY